ncbi:MAG: hypothetical protein AB1512_32720 [Thermodesulfobacteriota bacterium]
MDKEVEIGASVDRIATIAGTGLDMLGTLADRFRQEMGREFDRLWGRCLSELEGFAREMFSDLRLDRESLDLNVTILKSRYGELQSPKDEDMLILAFLAIVEKVKALTQVYLGEKPVRDALQAAVERLSLLEKYQQGPEVVQAMIAGLRKECDQD